MGFFPSFFFLNLKELLFKFWPSPLLSVTWSQANQLGKQKSCKSCKTHKVWTKPWGKYGVLAMQLGGPHGTWGLHWVLWNLTHLWAQISSIQDQALHSPPVTLQIFLKACGAALKLCPLWSWRTSTGGQVPMSTWAVRIAVFLGNFSIRSEKYTLVWIQPKRMALFCQIPEGSTWEYCHGRLRDVTPFKSLHCQTHSYRWAVPFLAEELSVSSGGFLHLCGPGPGSQDWC